MEHGSQRICIYVHVNDIDGCAQRRHTKVGEDFCQEILSRPFNPALDPVSYDHIHIPADFDSPKPLKRWFILDLDVCQKLSRSQVLELPHQVYLASKQHGKLTFTLRSHWAENAKKRAASYIWGGRQEQEMAQEMRMNQEESKTSSDVSPDTQNSGDSGGVSLLQTGQ